MDAMKLLIIIGLSCTLAYPRGFHVHGTKKHPIAICNNGELGTTWNACTRRWRA